MRTNNKILKIESLKFPNISFVSRNGEHRIINIKSFFNKLDIRVGDFGYEVITSSDIFNAVTLEDNALAWKSITKNITFPSGRNMEVFFHLDPLLTIQNSDLTASRYLKHLGEMVRQNRKQQNLSQTELARKIGTDKYYISKIENSKTDLEIKTLEKIIEVGLNKHFYMGIYNPNDNLFSITNSLLKPSFINWITSKRNNLTLIEGIDPKMSDIFLLENVNSPAQLSELEFSKILEIFSKHNKSVTLHRNIDSWRIQAKCIANSDWANLIMLQKTVGGNRSKIEDLAKKELNEDIYIIA